MSESSTFEDSLMKLQENKYNLEALTPEERESIRENAPVIFGACIQLMQESAKVQEKVMSTIDKVIGIFHEELKRPDISEETRNNLYDRIERQVDKSLQHSFEWKKFVLYFTVAVGGGVGLYFGGKNPAVRKAAISTLRNVKF